MLPLLLLLAATPPVLLEPDVKDAHRLHPRRVTASSFLENGWNSHAQNYLPLYVADDDAATAWVEGARGRGEGESLEWWGPALTRAKAFRVFLRNGYQKSDKLYRANARLKRVRLVPLRQGETGAEVAGAPVEVELKDVAGWQEVRLPTPPRVQGVRLTILSTWPGTSYDDTCLSDLRVYVQGEDPYRAEVEQAALEQVRRFAYERRMAAARKDGRARVELAPRYQGQVLRTLGMDALPDTLHTAASWLAALPEDARYEAALARAREAAALFDKTDLNHPGKKSEARGKWTRVRLAQLQSQAGVARVALSAMEEDGLVRAAGLLNLGDVAFFEADASQKQMKAKLAKARRAEAKELAACVRQCETVRKSEEEPEGGWDCDCEGECLGCFDMESPQGQSAHLEHQLEGGEFLLGPLARPTAYLRGMTEETGERESTLSFRQVLVAWRGDKADVVLTRDAAGPTSTAPLRVHVLEWSEADGKARLASITSFLADGSGVRVVRYQPVSS